MYLQDVTCTSASDCWAVGFYYEDFQGRSVSLTLIERWNGTEWTRVPSPNSYQDTQNFQDLQDNQLFGVTCPSASDCWAVGLYRNRDQFQPGPYQPMVEHWDGTSWTIVSSPNTGDMQSNYLYAVACTSASDCWAAGRSGYRDISRRKLYRHR